MTRQTLPIVSGVVAAVVAFLVMLLLDNSTASAAIYAVLVGLASAGVSYWQLRSRR